MGCSQHPARVHLGVLHEWLVEARNYVLAQRTIRSKYILDLFSHGFHLLCIFLPAASLGARTHARDPSGWCSDDVGQRIGHDQVAQAVPCGEQIAPERISSARAILQWRANTEVRRK